MTTERDPQTHIVLSWLHADAHEDAERVLQRALDEVDATSQRRHSWAARGLPEMNSFARLAIVSAAVVVVVVAGIQVLPRPRGSGGQPSPTAAPTATTAFPPLTNGPLAPGRYATFEGSATSVEVPSGWTGKPPFVRKIGADGAGLWWGPTTQYGMVVADACKGTDVKTADGTVRGLVDALDAQVGTNATITEVTLGGLPATRVDLVKDLSSCSGGASSPLNIFKTTSGGTSLSPGARGIVYVLEKSGELWAFLGIDYNSSASDVAELEEVIASTQFGS